MKTLRNAWIYLAKCFVSLLLIQCGTWAAPPTRDVVPGIPTQRIIPGEPFSLAGKRLYFTNWHYVNPGDLDWIDAAGKSVYVDGNSAPDDARFVGKEAPRGIHLMAENPQLIGPLWRPHRMILQDGALLRGWTDNEYYESTDGMKWDKKANMVFDWKGDGLYGICMDPTAPAAERFKAVWPTDDYTTADLAQFRAKRPDAWEPRALLHYGEGKISGIRGAVSADGITWKALPEPLVMEYSDTYNTLYFDTVLREYVIFTRYWAIGQRAPQLASDIRNSWTGSGRRAIGRAHSGDFRNFTPSELILEPSPEMLPSEVLYTNCYTPMPGAPDQHLMFPTIWNASVTDATRIKLASSSDGAVWNWVPGGDLLETGPFGAWNGGCIWATPNLVELPNKDWALPYMAHLLPHKYPRGQQVGKLGYAVWPKGRMVGLVADSTGQFTLMAVVIPGKKLKINAVTTRTGSIRVEVAGDSDRTAEACTPLTGDLVWKTVTWKGSDDLGHDTGTALRLRFKLDQARLYGLEFE